MTEAMKGAVKWLLERGGDAAVAKTSRGGRYFLAQGEIAEFTAATARKLIDAGLAEYITIGAVPGRVLRRLRLTDKARNAK